MRIQFRSDDEQSFIEQTIKQCDAYLIGERTAEVRDAADADERAEVEEELYAESLQREQQEWDEWLGCHCQLHGQALTKDNRCLACDQEAFDERIQDM